MQRAMKKLGMQQEEIEADAVIIRTPKEDIIIRNPSVTKLKIMGQDTYQVSGEEERRSLEPDFSEEDIKTVMQQAECDKDSAVNALKESEGDLAQAILKLKQ